jgi:hypothetical protein
MLLDRAVSLDAANRRPPTIVLEEPGELRISAPRNCLAEVINASRWSKEFGEFPWKLQGGNALAPGTYVVRLHGDPDCSGHQTSVTIRSGESATAKVGSP